MLQKLHIHNYAIIEEIEVCFSKHLNIITGETGAGKSILMGALSLILGERAESNVLLNKEKKCVVEGFFASKDNAAVKVFLTANDLDAEDELVLRREIAINGKSRAFINDTPVNLGQLKELSSLLVDLHQQFDTLELGDNAFQQEVLDALASNGKLLMEYGKAFNEYQALKKKLEALRKKQQEANVIFDYNQFLFKELEDAGLKENELEHLDAELKLLSHAEEIKTQLTTIQFELKDADDPLINQLKVVTGKLNALQQFHNGIGELYQRIQSVYAELVDIGDTMEQINDGIHYDPERLQLVNDKISIGYKLLKKHNVQTTGELFAIKTALQEKLSSILNIAEEIVSAELSTASLLENCTRLAKVISANRYKAVAPFTQKVNVLLKQVGMPNAQLKIDLSGADLHSFGSDSISFLFDANKTNRFEPLSKVASGGELSRLMLCIKSLVAQKLHLPTLIFDEIDTGISGEAAKQAGAIMKELAVGHQVLAITHQPQIAAKADAHYFVYKQTNQQKINTGIRLLSVDESISVIAQMLGGENPTHAALQNAREMMGIDS